MKKLSWLFVSILFSMVLGCASSDTGDGDDDTDCRNDGRGCTTGFACSANAAGEYECLPAEGSGDADAGNTNAGNTNTTVQCVEEGDNCTQESDCCNAGMFTCIGGYCVQPCNNGDQCSSGCCASISFEATNDVATVCVQIEACTCGETNAPCTRNDDCCGFFDQNGNGVPSASCVDNICKDSCLVNSDCVTNCCAENTAGFRSCTDREFCGF